MPTIICRSCGYRMSESVSRRTCPECGSRSIQEVLPRNVYEDISVDDVTEDAEPIIREVERQRDRDESRESS